VSGLTSKSDVQGFSGWGPGGVDKATDRVELDKVGNRKATEHPAPYRVEDLTGDDLQGQERQAKNRE